MAIFVPIVNKIDKRPYYMKLSGFCLKTGTEKREELANAITHGIGAGLAVTAFVVLVMYSDAGSKLGFSIYGITLVLLYLASTLYHSITHVKIKNFFRKLDHMAIYMLIAGTYTPFCLTALKGWLGWTMLGIVWGCAFIGIILKSVYIGRQELLSLLFYVVIGWVGMVAIIPIYQFLSFSGFILLLSGGIAYTLGTFFYVNNSIRYHHSIWHLFVLAGSSLHFFSIMSLTA